jgi:hypothetical protein
VTTYIAVVVTLALVGVVYNGVSGYLFRSRKELTIAHVLEAQAQLWDVLQLVKVQAESARVNRKEATVARDDTKSAAAAIGKQVEAKTEELKTKIEEVPQRVRETLAGASDSGHTLPVVKPGSGRNQVPQPPEGST